MTLTSSLCSCGKSYIPPRKRCVICGEKTSEKEIEPFGEIITYTTVYAVPEGFSAPINIALVLLGSNTKVICESRCNEMKIAAKVKIIEENQKLYCIDI